LSRGALSLLGVAALAVLSLVLVRDHSRGDSLSADEPVHILSGYFEVFGRTAIVNIEHPPVTKILAGLALARLPLPAPPARVPMGSNFTDFGHAFLFQNRVPADAIAAAAREPFRWVLAALVVLVFLWARSRYGAGPALFAAALVALDPNFLAHAGIVHTDVGASLGFLAAVLAWDRALARPSTGRLALAGAALGLALATKFSALYLIPILLVQGLFASRRAAAPARETGKMLARFAAIVAGAFAVVFAIYAAVTTRMDREDQRQVLRETIGERGAPALSQAIERLAAISPPLAHYAGGVAYVALQNRVGGGVNYLDGRISENGFPSYFFVAFLLKSTLGFLTATALAFAAAIAFRAGREAVLYLIPVAVLFLASVGSSYNIGIRHMLPVYPFLALAAASGLAALRSRGNAGARLATALAVAVPLSAGIEALRIHPHELSYFNALAGGPDRGRRILSDSNVDWGLDLTRLAAELRRRGISDPTVVYFGGDDVPERIGVPDFSADPRRRGSLVAVSAFHLAVGPAYYAYHGATDVARELGGLLAQVRARGVPAGRIGYSMYLFELPPEGASKP
jgi:hypothetical protein